MRGVSNTASGGCGVGARACEAGSRCVCDPVVCWGLRVGNGPSGMSGAVDPSGRKTASTGNIAGWAGYMGYPRDGCIAISDGCTAMKAGWACMSGCTAVLTLTGCTVVLELTGCTVLLWLTGCTGVLELTGCWGTRDPGNGKTWGPGIWGVACSPELWGATCTCQGWGEAVGGAGADSFSGLRGESSGALEWGRGLSLGGKWGWGMGISCSGWGWRRSFWGVRGGVPAP